VRRRDSTSGYALLAALVVMALASSFALAVVGAVHALQLVRSADADADRAGRLEEAATGQVLSRLRWAPLQASGSLSGSDAALREQWTADWETAPPTATSSWPRRRVRIVATASAARRVGVATVETHVEDWAVGVSCEHDAEVTARLAVSGSGLYVGGALRGRDQVAFGPGDVGVTADGRAVDGARGADCPVASVHAGAGIFAGGVEIHYPLVAAYADDGDQHGGVAPPAAWVAGPSPELLAAAHGEGTPAGEAFHDESLHLDAVSAADPSEMIAGRCVVLPEFDEVIIEGMAGEDSGPLLVIVPGDAVIGQPGAPVALRGALVVCGRLRVRSEFHLDGTLHAGSLEIEAPVSISVPGGWRDRPLPGAAKPVVVELDT
jgi:hypothetical protein